MPKVMVVQMVMPTDAVYFTALIRTQRCGNRNYFQQSPSRPNRLFAATKKCSQICGEPDSASFFFCWFQGRGAVGGAGLESDAGGAEGGAPKAGAAAAPLGDVPGVRQPHTLVAVIVRHDARGGP